MGTEGGAKPSEQIGSGLRRNIFILLVANADPMTPSEIGEQLETTRQQVKYHLDILTRMGIVIRTERDGEKGNNSGAYEPQPVFTSETAINMVEGALASIVPVVEDQIDVTDEFDESDEETIINNCVRMAVALRLGGWEVEG